MMMTPHRQEFEYERQHKLDTLEIFKEIRILYDWSDHLEIPVVETLWELNQNHMEVIYILYI